MDSLLPKLSLTFVDPSVLLVSAPLALDTLDVLAVMLPLPKPTLFLELFLSFSFSRSNVFTFLSSRSMNSYYSEFLDPIFSITMFILALSFSKSNRRFDLRFSISLFLCSISTTLYLYISLSFDIYKVSSIILPSLSPT